MPHRKKHSKQDPPELPRHKIDDDVYQFTVPKGTFTPKNAASAKQALSEWDKATYEALGPFEGHNNPTNLLDELETWANEIVSSVNQEQRTPQQENALAILTRWLPAARKALEHGDAPRYGHALFHIGRICERMQIRETGSHNALGLKNYRGAEESGQHRSEAHKPHRDNVMALFKEYRQTRPKASSENIYRWIAHKTGSTPGAVKKIVQRHSPPG